MTDLAGRKAEELRKGNQQKIQLISAILHEPPVLLMDEPFTGLDPVNVAMLREAFLEIREQGRTLIFSTHQMETVEAMCESIAIVDHGRVVVGGPLRDVKRASGRRMVHLSVDGDHRLGWLSAVPGAGCSGRGSTGRRSSSTTARSPMRFSPRRSRPAFASATSRLPSRPSSRSSSTTSGDRRTKIPGSRRSSRGAATAAAAAATPPHGRREGQPAVGGPAEDAA